MPQEDSSQPLESKEARLRNIAAEIGRMAAVDQAMRERSRSEKVWDESIDRRNTEAMQKIVAEIGWPTVSKVGRDVSSSAWLLVQHADHNPAFQKQCLELMKQQPVGEVDLTNIAYLEDRVRVNFGKHQLYGTQFHETRDVAGNVVNYGPRPIEDREHLDERRARMGLEPFAEYEKFMKDS